MLLSEAILKGCSLTDKAIGTRDTVTDGKRAMCVLGAAEFGATGSVTLYGTEDIWPFTHDIHTCPQTGKLRPLNWIMANLNNGYDRYDIERVEFEPWSRERIAEWIATIEPRV